MTELINESPKSFEELVKSVTENIESTDVVSTGAIPRDAELDSLRGEVDKLNSEQARLREQQLTYNRASEQYRQVDERLRSVATDLRSAAGKLKEKEQSLGDYIIAEKQFLDAEKTESTSEMLLAHDRLLVFMQRERDADRWNNALLAAELVVHIAETVRGVEKMRANALDSLRGDQVKVANEVVSEIRQSKAEYDRSQLEMKRLQDALKEAQSKLAEFEKAEAKDLKAVDKKYAEVLNKTKEQAKKNVAALSDPTNRSRNTATTPAPTPAPTPVPTPAPSARSNKQQPQAAVQPNPNNPPKQAADKRLTPRIPTDLSTPFSKQESDAVWALLMTSLGRTGDTSAVTITRREFARATSSDEQLKALFGVDLRQRFRAIDNDANQRMTKSELVSWLSYPSLRKSRTPSFGAVRDSMALFDAVKDGTGRIHDEEFELA